MCTEYGVEGRLLTVVQGMYKDSKAEGRKGNNRLV